MKTTSLVLLGLAALALLVPAQATGQCWTTSPATYTITGVPGGDLYVDNDPCPGSSGCLYSVWIYAETNHVPGQQRGDEVVNDIGGCDRTTGILADTDLF